MKRFSILVATVCAAFSGFAQGIIDISVEFPGRVGIPILAAPLLIQAEDEVIRDLALRKRAPNLSIGSHPYFRGPTTEGSTVDFPGGRVLPVFTDELIQVFPVISEVEPGVFRTFPGMEIAVDAIIEPVPLPTFLFADVVNERTSLEHIVVNPTSPGGRPLHTHSEIGDTVVGEFSAPTVTTVPEPGTCALFGLAGLAGWFFHRRRR